MTSYASFYPIIKNNRDCEPSCDFINQGIINHPKTNLLYITHIVTKKASIYNKNNPTESIFFVKITIFVARNAQSSVKIFDFYYIPIVKNSIKYYIIIKDSEAFLKTDLANFVFNVLNYNVIYNIVKPNHNNSNIIDILMCSLMMYMKIQNEEVAKIVTNMLANSAMFANDLEKENKQLAKIFRSQSYREYVRKNNILMKQIIGNNNLVYGIDYELTTKQACELLGIESIPVFPPRQYNPSIRTSAYGPTIDIITAPVDNMEFPTSIPGKEWVNFFDTIHISKVHDTFNKTKLENSCIIEFPKNLKNYDIFKNQSEGIERARKVQKKRNYVENIYSFYTGCYSEKANNSRMIRNYTIPTTFPVYSNSYYSVTPSSSIPPKKRSYSDTFEQSANKNDETTSVIKKSRLENMLQNPEPMIMEKLPTPKEQSVSKEPMSSRKQSYPKELPNLRELMNPELLTPNPRIPEPLTTNPRISELLNTNPRISESQNPDPRTPESLNLKLRQPLNPEPWNPKPPSPESQNLELLNSEPLNLKVKPPQNLEPPEISSDGSTISVNQDEINEMKKNLD